MKSLSIISLIIITVFTCNDSVKAQSEKTVRFFKENSNWTALKSQQQSSSNEEYKLDSIITWTFNADGDSSLKTKVINDWTPEGLVTMYASYNWDTLKSSWNGAYRRDMEYDESGNNSKTNYFGWDTAAMDWHWHQRIEYLYNDFCDVTEEKQYHREINSSEWVFVSGIRYEYNYADSATEIILSRWNEDFHRWDTSTRNVILYDENGLQIAKTGSSWNDELREWTYMYSDSLIRDENGRVIENAHYSWDLANQKWKGTHKSELLNYENNNNYTLVKSYSWNDLNNSWNIQGWDELEYSETGDLVLENLYYWKNSSFWQPTMQVEHDYDKYNNLYLSTMYKYDENLSIWFIENKTYRYYPYSVITGVDEVSSKMLRVYPTLVNDFLNIESEENRMSVSIYDLNGKQVVSVLLEKGLNTLNLGDLKPGVYVLQSGDSSRNFSTRIIKK